MEKEPKIKSIKGIPWAFINKDVIDVDFVDGKPFAMWIYEPEAFKQWQKRREEIIKKGLPELNSRK